MAGVHAMMMGSEGGSLYLKPNGVTVAAASEDAKGKWQKLGGKNYYVAVDYDDLVSVVSVYKGLAGAGEVLANLTRDGKTFYIPLNQVVTTFIVSLQMLFYNAPSFNQLINSWDASNVTNMSSMFMYCAVFNQVISGWNTSNVTNMSSMFTHCAVFNQDISSWCVSKILSKPYNFDFGTSASWTTAMKPKWGAAC